MAKHIIYLFILSFGFIKPGLGSSISFKATASKTEISVGERIQVTFTTNTSLQKFEKPSFEGFQLVQGPMQSYRQQNINGRISTVVTLTYVIQSIQEGTFEIGPATGYAGSEVFTTEPITIKVIQKSAEQERKEREEAQLKAANQMAEDLFIAARVDKTNVTVGEKMSVTYVLYTRYNLANLSVNKTPNLTGFWSKDIKSLYDNNLQQERTTYNGKQYTTFDLKTTILYPQRPGKLIIDPIELNALYQVQSGRARSMIDQMFGRGFENKEVLLKSKPIEINVSPLPSNQPDDFNGGVGNFVAEMKANKTQVKANEAINLTITISGKGNLHLLPAPELTKQPDLEIYDPKVKDQFNTNMSGISGKRTFDFLIIPRHEGTFTIPSYTFSYYDLSSKSYKTAATESLTLEVAKGDGEAVVSYSPNKKEEIELLNEDIIHIKKGSDELTNENEGYYNSLLFYLLSLLPFAILSGGIWFRSKRKALHGNKTLLRKTKANKMATKRLASAKKHLDKNDLTSFYQEIGKAVFDYFADKFEIARAELSIAIIGKTLTSKGVSQETIKEVEDLITHSEMARYAPSADIPAQKVYTSSVELISKIENQIK
jgi:hypothetical protein